MDTEDYQEFNRKFHVLDRFYALTGHRISTKRPRNMIIGFLTSYGFLLSFLNTVIYGFLIYNSYHERLVLSQLLFSSFAVVENLVRYANRLAHLEEMDTLVQFFHKIFREPSEYKEVVHRNLKATNKVLKFALWCPFVLYWMAGIGYSTAPLIMGSGGLPTPCYAFGVRDYDLPWKYFLLGFLDMALDAYLVVVFTVADTAFLAFSVVILSCRFDTIADILLELNYSGVRDRELDRRTIKNCYLMHLELLERIESFMRYFSTYGAFNISSVLFIETMLVYTMGENGIKLMNVVFYVAYFEILGMVLFLSQYLKDHAARFHSSISRVNWYHLHPKERQMCQLLLIRSRKEIIIRPAGLIELDLALMTQALKLQGSLSALLKNM